MGGKYNCIMKEILPVEIDLNGVDIGDWFSFFN